MVESGVLLGLPDSRLAPMITSIHNRPEYAWSLEGLAKLAGMSRARFAAHFRTLIGMTPFEYLTEYRIGVAQGLLKRGEPLKIVAPSVNGITGRNQKRESLGFGWLFNLLTRRAARGDQQMTSLWQSAYFPGKPVKYRCRPGLPKS